MRGALPVDCFVKHVAPNAFGNLKEALAVMLVCRKARDAAEHLWFWEPFLRQNRDEKVSGVIDYKRHIMFAKLYGRTDPAFFGWTPKQYVQSRAAVAPPDYRSHKGMRWCAAWEEGQLIEGLWVDGECEDYTVYCWTARLDVCRMMAYPSIKRCQYEWMCGMRFVGTQIRLKRCGHGQFTLADGAQITGEWADDECESAHVTFPPGDPRKEAWCRVAPGDGSCFEMETRLPMLELHALGWTVSQRKGVFEPFP
jgi:hypothetical protein